MITKVKLNKFAIVISRKDVAGMNIYEELKKLKELNPSSELPIYFTETDIVDAENIDKQQNIDADFIVFASKHQGKQEKMLSLHAPGNWKAAEFGGQENKVCLTSASVLKLFFQELNKNVPKAQGWQATLEVTHHGPYIEKPCLFIEIGSNKQDWQDKQAAKAIALTIKNSIKIIKNNNNNNNDKKYKAAIGIGGPHYCSNFNKIQLNSEYAISHIIPEYVLPLNEQMLIQASEKTLEKPKLAILDWKGMNSAERQKTIDLLNKLNIEYKRTSDVEK